MTTTTHPLTIYYEGQAPDLWGTLHYGDNLIVLNGESLEALQRQADTLLFDFHEVPMGTAVYEIKEMETETD